MFAISSLAQLAARLDDDRIAVAPRARAHPASAGGVGSRGPRLRPRTRGSRHSPRCEWRLHSMGAGYANVITLWN